MVVWVGLVALVLHFFVYKPNTEQIEQLESQIVELSDKVEEAKKALQDSENNLESIKSDILTLMEEATALNDKKKEKKYNAREDRCDRS